MAATKFSKPIDNEIDTIKNVYMPAFSEQLGDMFNSIDTLNEHIAKKNAAPWSGYTLTNRDSYVENGIYHLNFSVTVPAYSTTAGTWYTIAFCSYLPSNANGAKFPIVYSVNNKILPTLGQVVNSNNAKAIQALITADIKTTEASTAGNFYVDTSYAV